MSNIMRRLMREDEGQTLVEYALIIALVAIAVIALLTFLGKKVSNTYGNIGNNLAD